MRALRAQIKENRPARAAVFLAQNTLHGGRSMLGGRRQETAGQGTERYRLTAMVRVKNEARFLPEWLAHHVGLGVEHFYIYDNNSTDDIESVMRPFIDEGLATYVPWPTVPASPASHVDFLERFAASSTWVAFLDADEFLVENQPGALLTTLDARRRHPAVAVNSLYFGSAGHETIPEGLVTERFDRADPSANDHVKVIARPTAVYRYRNPHNFYYRHGKLARTPDGRRVFGTFVRASSRAAVVLHHYLYRSREDFERKARRGYSTATGERAQARRLSRADTEFHKHNDAHVTVPDSTREATARLLAKFGYPPELYESDA